MTAKGFLTWVVAWGGIGVTACLGGTIVGTVKAKPPAPPTGSAEQAGSAYDSREYKYVEKIDYDHLRDFVIYIDQPAAETGRGSTVADPATVKTPRTTTQKDANFEPHVLPVAVGTTVRWPNEDDIFHNVFSTSDTKQFDLGYYKKEKAPEVLFDKVGRVDVFCAIHTQMHCIILVVPNAFFAMADATGRFAIKNVPAGSYKLHAWHELLPGKDMEVVVPAEGEVKVDFVLGLGELPKY